MVIEHKVGTLLLCGNVLFEINIAYSTRVSPELSKRRHILFLHYPF